MTKGLRTSAKVRLVLLGSALLVVATLVGIGYAGDERPRRVPLPGEADVITLRSAALDFAARNGDPTPSAMRIGAGPRLAVVERLMGGAEVDTDQDVYIVALEGGFVGHEAHRPPGIPKPTGTNLVLIFDARTKELLGWAILRDRPDLDQFGTPIVVRP
jgi:hypothetical protein